MALADLTDRDAVLQAIQRYDELGRKAFLATYGFKPARDWVLVHGGRPYDSKAIAGVAYGLQHPQRGILKSSDFTGGVTTVVAKLRTLGFDVRRRGQFNRAHPSFTRRDAALFARYPQKVPFKDDRVLAADKEHFKDIRLRLKQAAAAVAAEALVGVPLREEASSYSQNGRSQVDLWACAVPRAVPNKSYGLQIAIIISARGAEVCFCLGAGQSQLKQAGARQEAEDALEQMKAALGTTPASVRRAVKARIGQRWELRRRWRQPARTRDFTDFDAWLAHAAGPDGNGASISRNFSPAELEALGPQIVDELTKLAEAVAPLLEHAYGAALRPARRTVDPLPALATALHLDVGFLRGIVSALEDRRQVILYGPPGTGKTYVARKLLEALAPEPSQREIVQFHPSYSYEDFVVGFRPALSAASDLGYQLQAGPLLRLAQRAAAAPGDRHLLLVDEINRGNVPRIFGELLYLLEYRDERISLMYAAPPGARGEHDPIGEDGRFALPENLWLVGTMNTADRSIGLIDAALRRRFHFIPFFPGEGALDGILSRWLAETRAPAALLPLASWVDDLNALLRDRVGRHLQIGHSYFMRERLTLDDVERIWAADIMPFLEDQLFDQGEETLEAFQLATIRGAGARADDPPD